MADEKNDQKNLANAYYYKGYIAAIKGDYAKAIYYLKKDYKNFFNEEYYNNIVLV